MRHRWQKGSVVLVALSCVTVLSIALAGFLALGNQAMKLSDRQYAKSVSKRLAEMGLEQALRSFNANTFSSWTNSGVLASRTVNIDSSHYGTKGITASFNIRVYHYLDTRKCTPWNVLTTYAADDFVWYQGVWYLCILAPTSNQDPSNTTYWKAAPEMWNPHANYKVGNIAMSGGYAYRCIAANVNTAPPNTTYWTAYSTAAWDTSTSYSLDAVAYYGGVPYRCISANLGHSPPNTTYWLSAPVIYSEGVAVLPDRDATTIKTQIRSHLAPVPLFSNAAGSENYTNLASTGTVDSYNSVLGTYNQTSSPFSVASPNVGSSAVVAGMRTSAAAVNITNVRVRGYLAAPSNSSSPYAPLYSSSTSGIVTSTASGTPSPKVDLTRVSRSPFVPTFDVQSVSSAPNLLTPGGTVSIPNVGVDTVSADGKYYYYTSGDLFLDTGDTLNITGPVVIDIRPTNSADLYIQRTGKIVIANNATASLEIHVGDEFFIYSQNSAGGIQNLTLDPKRCIIIGTSTYNFSGYHYLAANSTNLTFYGVIYLPDAYLHIWNSSRTQNIYGAVLASNVYFNHATDLHYDTSLRTAMISGVDAPYGLVEWRELTDPTEQISMP